MQGRPAKVEDVATGQCVQAHPFHYAHSENLPAILDSLGVTLLITTYQAGKLIAVRAREGRLSTLLRTFDQAMGMAVDHQRLVIGTRYQIWYLRNAPDIATRIEPQGTHDACFVPRASHVTGDIRCHDIGWAGEQLWVVNTRFSCLCTIDPDYSFVPRWQPPFVSAFAAEDRCHLNGLAIVDEQPRFVTALGETDVADGWRQNKPTGGCLIDVPSGELVARDLCMPHSPRWYQNHLWVLNSGTGRLLRVDEKVASVEEVAELPGYTRGLAFCGRFAFVGLSRIRELSTFGGLPIADRIDELKCGVWIVDLEVGQTVAFLQFEASVEEIFDVQILSGIRYPAIIGLQKEAIRGTFIVPPVMQDPI